MKLLVRRAVPLDARAIAGLLDEIAARDGLAAPASPVEPATIQTWMAIDPRAIWHLAEDTGGAIAGVQWIAPQEGPGPLAGRIATFVHAGGTGLAAGSALWEATRRAAAAAGFARIEAEIRADNAGGLAYYQSRGFEDHVLQRIPRQPDRVVKRFEL